LVFLVHNVIFESVAWRAGYGHYVPTNSLCLTVRPSIHSCVYISIFYTAVYD